MLRFDGGPAAGHALACRRAPIYLRVTLDETDGHVDALDLLDDTPGPSEQVHVYRRTRYDGVTIACTRGRDGGCSEIANAEYVYMPEIYGEMMRENEEWRAWCHAQPEARPRAEEFERSS